MESRLFDHSVFSGAEEVLAFVLESSTEYSVIGEDQDGRVILWNGGAERLYGYSAAEVVGTLNTLVLHPPDAVLAGKPREMRAAATKYGRWSGDLVRVRKNGELFVAHAIFTAWRGRDGQVSAFLLISRDVTEEAADRKKAEDKFRSLLESAPDAMVIVDKQGEIVLVNGQAETLFGYGRDELLGQRVEMLIPDRFRDKHSGHRSAYFGEPRVRAMGAGLELHGRRKDGTEFPVEISLSPLATEEGLLVSSSIRDITDRKRFERALQEKNVELESASLAKDRFLASMSHELRTPLNAIIGFTGTLLMKLPGPLTGDQDKQLRTIQTSARHLLSLINDLLDVAKIDSGKVQLNLGPVDCQEVIDGVATTLLPMVREKNLSFTIDAPEERIVVHSDRRSVSQILLNLAGNAIKFTSAGGIRLKLQRVGGEAPSVEITVEDTGQGIKEEDRAKLFQAFSQLEVKATQPREGTGLGLHLSQRLAGLLGGRIAFASEPGRGSSFTLHLPGA